MSKSKLFPLNPDSLRHIELLEDFKQQNNVSTPIGVFQKKEDSNIDFSMHLLLEEKEKVQDICHLQGFKDIKSCTISFVPNKKKKREILTLAADYALTNLGMETVYLRINPKDDSVMKYLEENEFECLGNEKGSIIYLKEKTY